MLYDKSRHTFGLSQAKEAIRKQDYAVVVEGNLDVVSSHQVGVKQVVATAGTAMTEHHLRALARLSGNVRLAFDGDKAGIAATERAIPIAQLVGVDIKVITLIGDAKDPDELIQKDPSLWQQSIDAAQPVVDWILDQYKAREDMAAAAGKRAFTTAALNVVRALKDPVEQEHYIKKIAQASDTSVEALARKLALVGDEKPLQLRPVAEPLHPATATLRDRRIDTLLAAALQDKEIQSLLSTLDTHIFGSEAQQTVAAYVASHGGTVVEAVPPELHQHEKYVTMLLLNPDIDKLEWSEQNRLNTARDVIRSLQANYQKSETKEDLLRQEAVARQKGDDETADKILMRINQLIRGEK